MAHFKKDYNYHEAKQFFNTEPRSDSDGDKFVTPKII